MKQLSTPRQITLLAVALFIWAFLVYIRWFASFEELRFIGATHIDKFAHLVGGIFIASLFEWGSSRRKLLTLLAILFGLTVTWEGLEYLFDAETRFFVATYPDLWRLDSSGDIIAALLGAYGYFVFAMNRSRASAKKKTP